MKQSHFNMSRIHGISDGVFAIAMTLLVLDIVASPHYAPILGQPLGDNLYAICRASDDCG